MQIDTTIEQAMTLSDTIAESVLDWRTNSDAIEATERLLETLYAQADMLGDQSNITPLKA